MRIKFVTCGALLAIGTLAYTGDPALAATSKLLKDPAQAAAPWAVEKRASGDLDRDGDLDVAILAVDGEANDDDTSDNGDNTENTRALIVLRKDPGGYRVVGRSTKAVLCQRCGGAFWGIMPAPVDLSIVKGVLVVKQTAGARAITEWTHRYRIEAERVRLIGTDRFEEDRASGDGEGGELRSTNLLTGTSLITTLMSQGDKMVITKKGKPRTVLLEAVELS